MRDDLETRVKQLEELLVEVQNENAKLRDLIVNPKWEYAWETIDAAEAKKYGELGWELVAPFLYRNGAVHLFFKRRLKA